MFVVVTEEDTLMAADFGKSLDGVMMLDAVRDVSRRLLAIIKGEETKRKGANGRNKSGRSPSRKKK